MSILPVCGFRYLVLLILNPSPNRNLTSQGHLSSVNSLVNICLRYYIYVKVLTLTWKRLWKVEGSFPLITERRDPGKWSYHLVTKFSASSFIKALIHLFTNTYLFHNCNVPDIEWSLSTNRSWSGRGNSH